MKNESRTSLRTTAKQNLQTLIRRKFLLFTGLFVSFLIIGGLITFFGFHNRSVVDGLYPETHREIREALIEQISNYDSSFTEENETISAPYARNSGQRTQSQQVDKQLNSSVFTRDYSVVSVEPEMQKESVFDTVDIVKATADSELEWLRSPRAIERVLEQGERVARDWVYGWLQVSTPVDASLVTQELTKADAEVVGRTGTLWRVKLPKDQDSLVSIQGVSWVSGLGVLPPAAKIAQDLSAIVAVSSSTTEHPLFITVMSDEEENFRRELSERGVKVGHFYADIRTFAVVSQGGDIEELSRLDFVQAIEPIRIVNKQHDSAVQAMGVDAVRGLGQAVGEYTGFSGESVGVAVMDSGLNTNHISISSLRESICGLNFVPNEENDLWFDESRHGTHVTGTVVGNGYFQPKMAGMAPGVEHIRFAKVLSVRGFGFDEWVNRGIDYLGSPISCPSNQWSDDAVKPLIVNMSLGGGSLYFDGKDTNARKLDSTVWSEQQLYVVSAGNLAKKGYSDYGAAKNSLTIGASHDTGDLVDFSSEGPTYDGRLLPNVVGTGVNVRSTEGGGQYETYFNLSGTSMSSPAVAGVAALLMDASPGYREHPALARARLMAGAVKPDVWLESEDHFPRDNTDGPGSFQASYGMGFVSARVAILNDDVAEGWFSSGTTVELEHNEVAYHDIEVPAGASRLDVVLT